MQPFLKDPAFLQRFVVESEELLQAIDEDLITLETSPKDEELLNRIFRAMHTIKGTAGFLALDPVVSVAHGAEEVLANLRRGRLQLTKRIMDALLAARDQMGRMLRDIRAGGLKQYSLDPLLAELQDAQKEEGVQALSARSSMAAPTESTTTATSPAVAVEAPLTAAQQSGAATAANNQAAVARQDSHSMRVDVRKLDELLNLTGELVLERNRLLQLAKQISTGTSDGRGADSPLMQSAARLSFITEELQTAGLRTRMVPIQTVFARFPRLVRDLAASLHKEVELQVHGQETEIDKTMVELISDPLVHLVRNSLDHGIELPSDRERVGKPRVGKITLQAIQDGDQILISVADDGAGIDPGRVVAKAIEKGMITPERASSLNKREALELIFLPGFSTVDKATNLSGRGVGMDVVRSNLKKLNGSIEVDSEPGECTVIRLRLPLTLAVLPVLLVEVAEETYALPLRSIVETLRFVPGNVHRFEGREVVCLRSEMLPLVRLEKLLSSQGRGVDQENKKLMALGETQVALLVDRLLGQESTVVKPLTCALNQCAGIAGATLGGDGRVRLVLDPAGLRASAEISAGQGLLQ